MSVYFTENWSKALWKWKRWLNCSKQRRHGNAITNSSTHRDRLYRSITSPILKATSSAERQHVIHSAANSRKQNVEKIQSVALRAISNPCINIVYTFITIRECCMDAAERMRWNGTYRMRAPGAPRSTSARETAAAWKSLMMIIYTVPCV